jgi:cytochrome c oxidase subunit 2
MFNLIKIVVNDAPYSWQIGFQNPATAIMEGIINFHHDLFFFIVIIIIFTYYMLARCVILYKADNTNRMPTNITHAPSLEIIWTLIPAFILFLIALPSFSLLYSMDEMAEPLMTIKAIGNQWYWTYELMDPNTVILNDKKLLKNKNLNAYKFETNFIFDSYMIPDEDLAKGQLRLLEVDNKLFLPTGINIRVLITSSDVLHSWAVPSFGIKLDSVPGRLNQTLLNIKRPGTFYGQCSEICGINHAFMPIVVQAVDLFLKVEVTQTLVDAIYPMFMFKYYRI